MFHFYSFAVIFQNSFSASHSRWLFSIVHATSPVMTAYASLLYSNSQTSVMLPLQDCYAQQVGLAWTFSMSIEHRGHSYAALATFHSGHLLRSCPVR